MFEFSEEKRTIPLHTFSHDGRYLGVVDTVIRPNMGPPNRTVYGNMVTTDNPRWNSVFRRVEYSDEYGAVWYINSSGEKISVASGQIKQEPPAPKDGFKTIWIDGKYEQIEDHIGETCYSTSTGEEKLIEELGPIPNGYTLIEMPSEYHDFVGDQWVYNKERHRPDMEAELRAWRGSMMTKVVYAIDKHRVDSAIPDDKPELKSKNPIDDNQLLELYALRIELQDLPDRADFPFCELPAIPEWLL